MAKENVYIVSNRQAEYPQPDEHFSPGEAYPEYPFKETASRPNDVYAMVREGFAQMGLDGDNYGKACWNPLGELIKPGQRVLLKPNWVSHQNPEESHDMSCLVTHPSVIRAVLDYVVIALQGQGEITVGDAPVQLADFERLQELYRPVWDFFQTEKIPVRVVDFRGMVAKRQADGTFQTVQDELSGKVICLNKDSAFAQVKDASRFRITNYATDLLGQHHAGDKHEYLLHEEVLNADVILNLPKPKSHRKAGLTACAKNFVGANMRKEFLPHHTQGSPEDGGDEYRRAHWIKRAASHLLDRYNNAAYQGRKYCILYRYAHAVLRRIGQRLTRDPFWEGSWYGNDTILKTIVDLNECIRFADQNGIMTQTEQRKVFHLCDMIVSGQNEGPMMPSPKHVGAIVMGNSGAAVDLVICRMVGFNPAAVRYIAPRLAKEGLREQDITVCERGVQCPAATFAGSEDWRLEPTAGWKGHI